MSRVVYVTALLPVSLEIEIGRTEARVVDASDAYDVYAPSGHEDIEMRLDLNGGRKLTEGQYDRIATALDQLSYESFKVEYTEP